MLVNNARHFLNSTTDTDSELIVKYNIRLKTLLQQGISEPIFYSDLIYKFKLGYHATVCMPSFKPSHGL